MILDSCKQKTVSGNKKVNPYDLVVNDSGNVCSNVALKEKFSMLFRERRCQKSEQTENYTYIDIP